MTRARPRVRTCRAHAPSWRGIATSHWLDPLHGVQSQRAFVEGRDGVRLVSLRAENSQQIAEEEAALEVRATGDSGAQLVRLPLATSRDEGAVHVIVGPDERSMLVAYDAWPAHSGVRLARLVCR